MLDPNNRASDSETEKEIDISNLDGEYIIEVRLVKSLPALISLFTTLFSTLFGITAEPIGSVIAKRLHKVPSRINDNESLANSAKNVNILQQLAVANLYFRDQVKQVRLIFNLCIVSAISVAILKYSLPVLKPDASASMIILLCLMGFSYIRLYLIAYRISNGHFGNNRDEITSLISFFLANSDDIDSSGGGKTILVYPQIEQSQQNKVLEGLEGLGA
jgi:hypothetical protein